MPLELPVKRVQRVRHELKLRELLVHRVREVSPALRRVTFVAAPGHSLHDFVSASFDDHVKLMFDAGDSEPVRRDYTPRRFDAAAGELDIEFALHGHGPASAWAAQAAPGQTVRIGGPRGRSSSIRRTTGTCWWATSRRCRPSRGAWRNCRPVPGRSCGCACPTVPT